MRKNNFFYLVSILILLRAFRGAAFGTAQIFWTCAAWIVLSFTISHRKSISILFSKWDKKIKKGNKSIFNFEKAVENKQDNALSDAEKISMNHAWMRINEKLKLVYPNATWSWTEESLPKIEKLLLWGGAGYIKTANTGEFSHARVDIDRKSRLEITMIRMEPLPSFLDQKREPKKPSEKAEDAEAIRKQQDNVEKWYRDTAHRIIDAALADLSTRGYCKMFISESGKVYVTENGRKIQQTKLTDMPDRRCWPFLVQLLQRGNRAVQIMGRRICLDWSK